MPPSPRFAAPFRRAEWLCNLAPRSGPWSRTSAAPRPAARGAAFAGASASALPAPTFRQPPQLQLQPPQQLRPRQHGCRRALFSSAFGTLPCRALLKPAPSAHLAARGGFVSETPATAPAVAFVASASGGRQRGADAAQPRPKALEFDRGWAGQPVPQRGDGAESGAEAEAEGSAGKDLLGAVPQDGFSSPSARADLFVAEEQLPKLLPNAARKLSELGADTPGAALRLRVQSGGCASFRYEFSIVPFQEDQRGDDIVVEAGGARLLIDLLSLSFLDGCEVDYVESMMRASFQVAQNRAADSRCGCGSSFSPNF